MNSVVFQAALLLNLPVLIHARLETTALPAAPQVTKTKHYERMALNCMFACNGQEEPQECKCDTNKCKTHKCESGDRCILVFGRFPHCVKDPTVCTLPKTSTKCKASVPNYFFNTTSRECEEFENGQCGTNGNMFSDRMECYRTCQWESGLLPF